MYILFEVRATFREGTTQTDIFKTLRAWPKSLISKLRTGSIESLLSYTPRLKFQAFYPHAEAGELIHSFPRLNPIKTQ
ncbi:hypothetical protein A9Q77_07330 [Marinomonas sp. 42_23_T18]|nr:hypothetical protein A9Q77_07330 [Marinomonas sp. 42_23_T18]